MRQFNPDEATAIAKNRSVFTHEFSSPQDLINEYLGNKSAPTFEEICNFIPKEKRIILGF